LKKRSGRPTKSADPFEKNTDFPDVFSTFMAPQPNSTIVLSGHKDSVRAVAWNITGTRLASGSTDKTIRVWNPEKPEVRYSILLKGHASTVDQLCWDPTNPDQLVSASHDKTVRFWDYRGAARNSKFT
jgi:WD40 repeat protein